MAKEEAERQELERLQQERIAAEKLLEEEKQKKAESEKSDIQKQIEIERAELERLRQEKQALSQQNPPKLEEKEPDEGDKSNVVLPLLFVILCVGSLILGLYLRPTFDNSFIAAGISLGVSFIVAVLSIIFMSQKKYTKATKWMFIISLLIAIGVLIASVVVMLGSIPGSK